MENNSWAEKVYISKNSLVVTDKDMSAYPDDYVAYTRSDRALGDAGALEALPELKYLLERIRGSRLGHFGTHSAYVLSNGVREETLKKIEAEIAAHAYQRLSSPDQTQKKEI